MKRIFYHEKGNVDEAWFYLVRDAETGAVYVEHQWGASDHSGSDRIDIIEFLEGPHRPACNNLLRLVGAMIEQADDALRPPPARRKEHLN